MPLLLDSRTPRRLSLSVILPTLLYEVQYLKGTVVAAHLTTKLLLTVEYLLVLLTFNALRQNTVKKYSTVSTSGNLTFFSHVLYGGTEYSLPPQYCNTRPGPVVVPIFQSEPGRLFIQLTWNGSKLGGIAAGQKGRGSGEERR